MQKIIRKWNKSLIISFRKEEQEILEIKEGDIVEIDVKVVGNINKKP